MSKVMFSFGLAWLLLFQGTPQPTSTQRYNHALALYEEGDLAGASMVWRSLLEEENKQVAMDSAFNLAVALVERDLLDQAQATLRKYGERWPEDEEALRNLEWLMLEDDSDDPENEDDQEEPQQPPPGQEPKPQPPQPQQPEQEPLSKEQAEKILQRTVPPRAAPPSPRRPEQPATQPW